MRYGRWFCLAALLVAASFSPALSQPIPLRYGQIASTAKSVASLYLFVAERQGLFAQEGIALQTVPIACGTDKMVAALDAGTVELAQTATPYLIRAIMAGSDAVAIAGETATPIYSLIVKPEIAGF